MPITFANIPLTPPHNNLGQATEFWHGMRIEEEEYPGYRVPAISHLPIPYPPERGPSIRIGVLRWPTGADRWARCHLVATGEQVDAIQAVIGTSGTPQTLTISDGLNFISTRMYLLPPRPILQKGTEEWYLLTLVCQRYYWWMQGATAVPITNGMSWSAFISACFAEVGVTPTIDAIASAYLTPNVGRWDIGVQPMPMIIEAACRQVGMRVVRNLDGSVNVVNAPNAIVADASRWTSIFGEDLAGGQIDPLDIGRYVPQAVATVFLDGSSAVTTLASLSISEFGGVTGVAGATGLVTADPDPSTLTVPQYNAYATQSATDYYLWSLSVTDADLRGIVVVNPTGLDEWMEWVHHPSQIATRIIRPQWTDRNIYGSAATPDFPIFPGSGSGSGGACANAITPVSFTCSKGTRTATIKSLAVGVKNNQLVISDCGDTKASLGPCSPTNPEGTRIPVSTAVCPVFGQCVTATTNVTLGPDVLLVYIDASGGSGSGAGVTVTLPPWQLGQVVFIVRIDSSSNSATVVPPAGTINGGSSISINEQWTGAIVTAECTPNAWTSLATGTGGGSTGTSVTNNLASSVDLTTSVGSWIDTGLSISLQPGKYLLTCDVRASLSIEMLTGSNTGYVSARITDGSGTEIARRCIVNVSMLDAHFEETGPITIPYSVSVVTSVKLQGMCNSSAGAITFFDAKIESGAALGWTSLTAVPVAG